MSSQTGAGSCVARGPFQRLLRGFWGVMSAVTLGMSLVGGSIGRAETPPSPSSSAPEFARPDRGLSFPRDHGSHPTFETEWWYVTGHLVSEGVPVFGTPSAFGVQLTFFRRRKGDGTWGQVYAAHGALGEAAGRIFSHDMRYGRSGMGVASVALSGLTISLLDWGLETIGERWLLRWNVGTAREVRLLTEPLSPEKIVRHGVDGFSKKAPCGTCASMYYSVPQLRAEGEVRINGSVQPVTGVLWMDHEFMTNALQPDQVGWDWFSLMTQQGQSIMLFRVRGKQGAADYFSGTFHEGRHTTPLGKEDFVITPIGSWTSQSSQATYPQGWRIQIARFGFDEVLGPVLADQEVRTSGTEQISYWEGAIQNSTSTVKGYAELTGYGKPIVPGL